MNAPQAAAWDRLDELRAMLDSDPARIHERGFYGTPLDEAVLWSRTEIVAFLLERGAGPTARSHDCKP